MTLTKDRSTFIIQHEEVTRFGGWDPENRCIKVSTFYSNGRYDYSLWRLVDSKPTYRIEVVVISPDGTKSPSKATMTVLGEDHWQYTPDGAADRRLPRQAVARKTTDFDTELTDRQTGVVGVCDSNGHGVSQVPSTPNSTMAICRLVSSLLVMFACTVGWAQDEPDANPGQPALDRAH